MPKIFRVALDTPLRRLFDYLPPAQGTIPLSVGARVRVPFGRQRRIGIIAAVAETSQVPVARLKPILEVLDATPVIDSGLQQLLRWGAEYYHHPLGEAVSSALPRALRLGAPGTAREEGWLLTETGALAAAAGEPRRAPRQRALLESLLERRAVSAAVLDQHLGAWRDAARALAARGWIASTEVELERAPAPATVMRTTGPPLLPEQAAAVAAVAASLDRFGAVLLHGITARSRAE